MIPKEKQINLRLSHGLYEWLKEYAHNMDKPMSAIIRELLAELKKREYETQNVRHDDHSET